MRGILYSKINRDSKADEKTEGKFKRFFKDIVEKSKEILEVAVISLAILCGPNTVKADVSPASVSATEGSGSEGSKRTFEISSYNNDAGGSLTGSVNPFSGFEQFRLTVGGVWINNGSYPIGSVNLDPNISLFGGTLVLNYFGNATLTNMASVFYTTNGVGGSVHFDVWKFTVHAATLLQGAISLPTYDLLYARWLNGVRFDIGNFQLSIKNTEYFAASVTPKTSWAFDYRPRYQGLGAELSYSDDINKISVGTNNDSIHPTLWAEYSRTVYDNNKDLRVEVGLSAGMDGFNLINGKQSSFFPDRNFFALFNIKVEFPDSKYSAGIERRNISQPSEDKQFVYENGDITAEQRQYTERAKENILKSQLFGDLIAAYQGASKEELLTAANEIASLIGRGGYDYGAYNDLKEFNIFSPKVKALTERNYNDILYFLREYLKYYQEHGTYDGMPEELKRGVAICAGIHEFVAEFLRANGMDAYTMTVVTPKSPHVVAVAFYDGKASIIDYAMRYTTKGNLDDVLNVYSKATGVPILQTQIFGRGGKYLGTYTTQQGKIVQKATSSDGNDWLDKMLNQDPRSRIVSISGEIDLREDLQQIELAKPIPAPTPAPTTAPTQPQPTTPEVKPEEKREPSKEELQKKEEPQKEEKKPSEKQKELDIFKGTEIDTKGKENTKKPETKVTQKENQWPEEEPKKSEPSTPLNSALDKAMSDISGLLTYKHLKVPSQFKVRLTINHKKGKIIDAKVLDSLDSEVKKIIERELKRVKFTPDPNGKEREIIDYTLTFSSNTSIEF